MSGYPFLVEMAWKAGVLLSLACCASWLLRRHSAGLRQFVWTLAFGGLLLLPITALLMRPLRWGPRVARAVTSSAVPQHAADAPDAAPNEQPTPHPVSWQTIVLLMWAGGAAMAAGRLALGSAGMWLLLGRAEQPGNEAGWATHAREVGRRLGLKRQPALLVSAGVSVPITWGARRPVVVLPEAAHEWPLDRLRLVLAHEFAHIRRWDYLGQVAAQFACALYWFHPLAWWALRQLVREREQACDDEVLNMGIKATEYAGHLLEIVKGLNTRVPSRSAAIGMAAGPRLETRLKAILDASVNRRPMTRRVLAFSAAAAWFCLLPLAGFRALAQSGGGTIAGVVHDPSGAVVPHALITATNADGSNVEMVSSGADGSFRINGVPAGHYSVEVRSRGFALNLSKNIVLATGGTVPLDVNLRVGSVIETVEVLGKRPQGVMTEARAGTPQRIRVGGNIQASKLITRVQPVYPESALRNGVQGTVLLRAVIGTDGRLLSLNAASASTDASLTAAALDAVRLWTYEPTLLNGEPVEVRTTVAVTFRLD